MSFVAFLLTLLIAVLFVVACGVIVRNSRFKPPYDTWAMWAAGGLALLYLVLALLGQVPLVPVPDFNGNGGL